MNAPRTSFHGEVPGVVTGAPVTELPVKVREVVRSSWDPLPPWVSPSETTCAGSEPDQSVGISVPVSGMKAILAR